METRVVPLGRDASTRFLPWMLGLMMFLAVLSLATAMALWNAGDDWRQSSRGTLTVQVLPPSADAAGEADDTLDAATRRVVEALQSTPGIESVRLMTDEAARGLLRPWLGAVPLPESIPLPRMIDVTIRAGEAVDLDALSARLEEVAPGTIVDDHALWLEDLLTLSDALQAVALGIVILILIATAVMVVFVTRTGLAVHHEVIDLLHLIGARPGYISSQFEAHAIRLGMIGGVPGTVVALAVVFGLAMIGGGDRSLVPDLWPEPVEWAALGLLPVVTTFLAAVTARITVFRTISRFS